MTGVELVPIDTNDHEDMAKDMATVANLLVVTNQQDFEEAGSVLKGIKTRAKEIEAARVALTKPLLDHKKFIDGQFKPVLGMIGTAELTVKIKMAEYQAAETRRIADARAEVLREAERKAEALRAEGNEEEAEEAEQEPFMAPVEQAPKAEGVSFREKWEWEVVDEKAIPRAYLMVDEKKVAGVVRAMKGDTNIPGVRVREGSSVVSR